MEIPDPMYVKTEDGAYIAYQVVGDGPVDIAWQLEYWGNIDAWWDLPLDGGWFRGLAGFARLILHDRRATGLSSRDVPPPNLETRAADLRLVLDAAGSDATVLGGWFESMAPCLLLAASAPDRVRAAVWWDPVPCALWAPDFKWGDEPEHVASEREALTHWGTAEYASAWADRYTRTNGVRPSEAEIRSAAKLSRNTCTPDVALKLTEIWWETDIRGVLPAVQVPTLLMVAEGGGNNPEIAEYVASLMPNAKVEVFPPEPWPNTPDEIGRHLRPRLEAIQRFIGIEPKRAAIDTILTTVLFTDIVGSSQHQSKLGDRAWKELVERHHEIVRQALDAWRGVENDTAGDGFYATFDGPARAIHCAIEICDRVRDLGIQIRAGVHTGECELIDGKAGGIAVTTGARISALAAPSQVLVSQTVKDLVAGSGFTFGPNGERELTGVPDRWRLYAAT